MPRRRLVDDLLSELGGPILGDTKEVICRECDDTFEVGRRSQQVRCDPCRTNRKKDQDKDSAANRRIALRSRVDQQVRNVPLICGHTLRFRMVPLPWEELYCERCDDWILQKDNQRNLCRRGHPQTFSNVHVSPNGRRSCGVCRKNQILRQNEKRKKKTNAQSTPEVVSET